jgi:hypothetical protein
VKYTLIWENSTSRDMSALVKRDGAPAKQFKDAVNALSRDAFPRNTERYGRTDTYFLRIGVYSATYRVDANRVAVHVLMVRGQRL